VVDPESRRNLDDHLRSVVPGLRTETPAED
jgi:hypothetical protein